MRAVVALLAAVVVPVALAADPSLASADGRFVIAPKRVASGGGHSEAGMYDLDVTIGQSEASPKLAGGPYEATLGLRTRTTAPIVRPDGLFSHGFE
jgi:hypothetical protein